ncbi:MAG: type II secretion system F family protein [Chloroflexi bacterium]|nr:type II secretion system F family protein [Chloroflexota bacterium]
METIALLAPLLAFAVVTVGALAIHGYVTGNRRLLQQRLAGYGRGAAAVAMPGGIRSDVLREQKMSDIPLLEQLLGQRNFATRMAEELASADIPLRVGEYLLLRWMCGVLLLVVTIALDVPLIVGLALGIVGFYLPKLHVGRRRTARRRQFEDQLVDALTMMSNSLKSGASFLQAMELVSQEMPSPIGAEFGQVVAEVGVGATPEDALTGLSERIQSYDLKLVVTAILVQRAVGGNLAEVLGNIAHTIRERMRILREVQVMTAQQRLSAAIVGAMPVFLLFAMSFTARSHVDTLLYTPSGRIMLALAFGLDMLGFITLRRLAKIDV